MKGNLIEFYYFTGTGNTLTAVNEMREVFSEKGISVNLLPIEQSLYPDEMKGKILGLAIPANTQSTLPFIYRFIKSLPKSNGTPVFLIVTCNESGGLLKPLYRILKRKGYDPAGACEVSMPNNLIIGPDDENQRNERLKKAANRVRQFAADIIEGKTKWEGRNSGPVFVSWLSRNTPLLWVSMRLIFKLKVDKDKCEQCGLCIAQCPVKNIWMEDWPVHGTYCEFCMRCTAFCPGQAVFVKGRPDVHAGKSIDRLPSYQAEEGRPVYE